MMELTLKGETIRDMFLEGQDYSKQEVEDIWAQLVLEKSEPIDDIVIVRGKQYKVKRATFNTIVKVNSQILGFQKLQKFVDEDRWYNRLPIVGLWFAKHSDRAGKRKWKDVCEAVFEGDVSDFDLGELTPLEMKRIMRIFFQFRAALFQDAPEESSETSRGISKKASPSNSPAGTP